MVKRLAKERTISVREAERWLDVNAYLKEQQQWAPGGLHHENLCQQMFLHDAATSQSEHDCTICWGRRKPSSKWDLGAEPTAMELVCPDSTWEDIEDLYWDVYQPWRLPRRGWCREATEECLCRKIINSLKEHLWLKWPSAQPEGEQRQLLADIPWPDPHMEFTAANWQTYEKFTTAKQDSYEGMMTLVRDAHQQALVAVALLEEKMEWMSCSIYQQCSGSHQCSVSHQCRRSWSSGCWREDPQVMSHCRQPEGVLTAEGPQVTSCHSSTQ